MKKIILLFLIINKKRSFILLFLILNISIFSQKKKDNIYMKSFSEIPVKTNIELIKEYKLAKNLNSKIKSIENLAYFHINKGNIDSLIYYSELLYNKINLLDNKQKYLSKALNLKAIGARKKGLFDKALKYHIKGIEYAKKTKDKHLINLHKYGIGIVYFYKKKYKEANKLYDECLKKTNDSILINNINKRKADIYLKQNNFKKAKLIYNKTIHFYKQKGLLKKELEVLLSQAKIFELNKNNNKAFSLYNDVKNRAEKNKFYDLFFLAQNNIGRLFFILKQYDDALATLNVSYANSVLWNNLDYQKEVLNNLRIVYLKTKNYKKAYDVLKIYTNVSNKILKEQNKKEINKLEIEYKTLQKEKEILELKKEKYRKAEELSRQKNIKKNILIGFIIFLIPIIALLYMYYQKLQTQSELNKTQQEINNQKIESLLKEQELQIVKANVKGQNNERKRLAQELHDSIGGSLAAIKLQLSSITENNTNLKYISKQIDDTYNQVRNISHNLIPKKIKNKVFVKLIKQYIKNISNDKTVIIFQPHPVEEINNLSEKLKVALYTIIQELLTNAIKHAKASEINIYLNKYNDSINLIFEDNGIGFQKDTLNKGIGLINIKNRIKDLYGNIKIDSHNKSGTVFIIDIPL